MNWEDIKCTICNEIISVAYSNTDWIRENKENYICEECTINRMHDEKPAEVKGEYYHPYEVQNLHKQKAFNIQLDHEKELIRMKFWCDVYLHLDGYQCSVNQAGQLSNDALEEFDKRFNKDL